MTTTEIATEPEESKKAKRVREKDISLHGRESRLQLDIRTKSPPSGDSPPNREDHINTVFERTF